MYLFLTTGKWRDEVCTRKKGYVCKQLFNWLPPPSTTLATGYCPAGYSGVGNKCLRVFGNGEGEQLKSWQGAWDACSMFGPGYTLASVSSWEENCEHSIV
jgi:hypothetical protein